MARLGELLVELQMLTAEQVEHGLRAQVMWGGRLGTNLIELGYLDLDQLSSALGKLLKLPAAFARHFEKADPAIQRRLKPEIAERLSVVPLMQVPSGKLVVASLDKLDLGGRITLSEELGIDPAQLVPSIAAELRIRYQLELVYKISRGARFLRSRGKTIPPFPQFEADALQFEDSAVTEVERDQRERLQQLHAEAIARDQPEEPEIEVEEAEVEQISDIAIAIPLEGADTVKTEAKPSSSPGLNLDTLSPEPDDLAVPFEAEDDTTGRERRKYVRMITDEPSPESERQKLGRIAIRRVAVTASPPQNMTLAEATRAIRRSTDRDKVADLVLVMLERFMPACEAAVMLVVRGEVAIGWRGYCREKPTLPEVAVPLGEPGLIPTAIQKLCIVRAPVGDLGEIDTLFLQSLGCVNTERELIVLPVTIARQPMLTIALVAPLGTEIATAESIAGATGAAFARLMRDASR